MEDEDTFTFFTFFFFFFYNCIVPVGFLPWEIWVAFPGEMRILVVNMNFQWEVLCMCTFVTLTVLETVQSTRTYLGEGKWR